MRSAQAALVAVASVFAMTTSAFASAPTEVSKQFPELLSYERLASLDSAKREAYLRGLRDMLVELAAISEQKRDDMVARNLEELRGKYLALQALFPEAIAAEPKAEIKIQARDIYPAYKNGAWVCEGGGEIEFDPKLGACRAKKRPEGDKCPSGDLILAKVGLPKLEPKAGENPFYKYEKSCVPISNWNRLSADRQKELVAGAKSVEETVNKGNTEDARKLVLGAGTADKPTGATVGIVQNKTTEVRNLDSPAQTGTAPKGADVSPTAGPATKPTDAKPTNQQGTADNQPMPSLRALPSDEEVQPVLSASKGWECVPKIKNIIFDKRLGTCRLDKSLGLRDECEAGKFHLAKLSDPRGTRRYCVPEASWQALSESRRQALMDPKGASQLTGRTYEPENMPDAGRKPVFADKGNGRTSGGKILLPAGTEPAPSNPNMSTQPAAQPNAKQQPASSTCTAPTFTCEGTWAERRKAYYQDPDIDTCIFSGNISSFIEGQKQPGRCKSVFDFSFTTNGKKYRCASYKETMCNPLVFGLKKEGTAFCVPGKSKATKECDAVSTDEARMTDFLNQDIPGLQESWNQFRIGFNKLCKTSETSRRFHCEECQVIAARLVKLNALAGSGCGETKEWNQIKGVPAKDPKTAD